MLRKIGTIVLAAGVMTAFSAIGAQWVMKEGNVKLSVGNPALLKVADGKPGESIAVQGEDGSLAVVWGGRGGVLEYEGLKVEPGKAVSMELVRAKYPEKPKSWLGTYFKLAEAGGFCYEISFHKDGAAVAESMEKWKSIGSSTPYECPVMFSAGRLADGKAEFFIDGVDITPAGRIKNDKKYELLRVAFLNPVADDISLIEFKAPKITPLNNLPKLQESTSGLAWRSLDSSVKVAKGNPAELKRSDGKKGRTVAVQGEDGSFAVVWSGRGGKLVLNNLELKPGEITAMEVRRMEFPNSPKSWIGLYYRLANAENRSYNFTLAPNGFYLSENQPEWKSIGGREKQEFLFTIKAGMSACGEPVLFQNNRRIFTGNPERNNPYNQLKFEFMNPNPDDMTLIEFGPVKVEKLPLP